MSVEDGSGCAIDAVIAGGEPQTFRRHAVLGERAGLVGADHGRGAESLDRGQTFDHGIALGHALHAAGERHGRDDRQALGDGSDGEGDSRLDHQDERLAGGDARGGDQGGDQSVAWTSWPVRCSSLRSSGDASGFISITSCVVRPSSVAMPVATTTPRPVPRVMAVPL